MSITRQSTSTRSISGVGWMCHDSGFFVWKVHRWVRGMGTECVLV